MFEISTFHLFFHKKGVESTFGRKKVLKGNLTFFFYGFSETLTVNLRFHDFLGVQKLKLKVVSLKPRVSTEEEAEGLLLS